MLHRIVRITYPGGKPVTFPDALARIGREGHITQMEIGCPLLFAYAEPDVGILRTSRITKVKQLPGGALQIPTQHHIYRLQEVETAEPVGTIFCDEE